MESLIKPDASALFAGMVAETDFDRLSPVAVDAAKKSILDTLAVMAAAAGSTPSMEAVAGLALDMGGRDESTITGENSRAPAMMAAFANGAMVHCLDFDDVEYKSVYHPSGAVVPAALAVAERYGSVSGKDFITAVALGQDIGIRMARAIPSQRKPAWHRSVVIGTFAAAVAAAKILRLDSERMVDVFGHALCQAAGSLELRWGTGSEIGGMYAGFSAKAGVFSALLAERGIAGIKSALDGPAGFFNLYYEGNCDRHELLDGLGREFRGEDTALKPWPACAATNTYILATINLMRQFKIEPKEIDKITLYVGDYALKNCDPLAVRRRPTSAPDAKFSLPYNVAVAALKYDVKIADFSFQAISDPRVLEMAGRIDFEYDAEYDISDSMPPGAVRIITCKGECFFRKEDVPHGHPSHPLTWEQVMSKSSDCLSHAGWLARNQIASLVNQCRHLEQVKDISQIANMLRSAPTGGV